MDILATAFNFSGLTQESGLKEKTFDFLIKLMGHRNQLRINHWQTTSYAEHMMTNGLLGDLDGIIDTIGEYIIGALGRPQIPTVNNTISDIQLKNSKMVLDCIECETKEIIQEYKITDMEGMINLLGELDDIVKKYKYLSTLE